MSNETDMKIIWILGAGFSKPLGAPLLDQLLSEQSGMKIRHVYAGEEVAKKSDNVAMLFKRGVERKYWRNAEEFLELLDLSIQDESARNLLMGWANAPNLTIVGAKGCEELRFDGLRMLAAEVCMFLKGAAAKTERLAPYAAWARSLGDHDTILSFNYDRVIEVIAGEREHGIKVPLPHEAEAALGNRKDSPVALKLHGSVDWYFDLQHHQVRRDDPESAALLNMPEKLAIATPGPTKHRMISSGGLFEPLWRCAAEELQRADAIVLIGYRMPATDAYTKQWIIDRLRETVEMREARHGGNPVLGAVPIHSVLGPDLTSSDNIRLKGLLAEIDVRLDHRQWGMSSDDFLGLVQRDRLVGM